VLPHGFGGENRQNYRYRPEFLPILRFLSAVMLWKIGKLGKNETEEAGRHKVAYRHG
jgi:hypothetical protein